MHATHPVLLLLALLKTVVPHCRNPSQYDVEQFIIISNQGGEYVNNCCQPSMTNVMFTDKVYWHYIHL